MDRRVRHNSQGDHFSSTNCSSALSGSISHSQSGSPQNLSSSPNEFNNKLVDATHWSVSPIKFNHFDDMETYRHSVQNYVWHKTLQPVEVYSSDNFKPMGMARMTRGENYQMLQELAIAQSLKLSYHGCRTSIGCPECKQNAKKIKKAIAVQNNLLDLTTTILEPKVVLESFRTSAEEMGTWVRDWNDYFDSSYNSENLSSLSPPQFNAYIMSYEMLVDSPPVKSHNVAASQSVPKPTKDSENVVDPENIVDPEDNSYNNSFPTLQSSHSETKPNISVAPETLPSEPEVQQVKSFAEVMQNKETNKDFALAREVPQPPIVRAVPNRNVKTDVKVTNSDVVAQIVGTNRSHLSYIERLHGVRIENPGKKDQPIFTISGEKAKVEEAKAKLLELDGQYMAFQRLNARLMATMRNPICVKLFVPEEHLGFVIGADGNVISSFQWFYKVVIKTEKNYDSNGQLVTTHFSMTGDEKCIRAAVEAIVQRLREAMKWMLFNSEFFLEKKECYILAAIKPKPQKRFWPLRGSKF